MTSAATRTDPVPPRPGRKRRPHHDWVASTPILDLARVLVAVASVMILGYDLIFLAFAIGDSDWGVAAKYVAIAVAVGLANLAVDLLRRWRRHHG